jgi:hypothetical protein
VEEDYKYMLFDVYADKAAAGELTLEQAMIEYTVEVAWIEHQVPEQIARLLRGTDTLRPE